MTDKNLLERLSRLVKVEPIDNRKVRENSWNEHCKSLLSTEKKIYAIKLCERENRINTSYPLSVKPARKQRKCSIVTKWLTKCKWKLPKTMIIVSVLQVSKYFAVQ